MRETVEKDINALKQLIKGKIHSRTRNLLLFIFFTVLLQSSERFGLGNLLWVRGKDEGQLIIDRLAAVRCGGKTLRRDV